MRRVDIDSVQSRALVWTVKSECRLIPKFRLLAPCPCDRCHMDMDLDEKPHIGAFSDGEYVASDDRLQIQFVFALDSINISRWTELALYQVYEIRFKWH